MKKIILIALSLAISAVSLSAQDMAAATETYNNGATALNMGDNAGALQYFRDALTMAEACGDEGADIVANCKSYIPVIALSIAKGEIKDGNYEAAITKLDEAIKIAGEFDNADVAAEAPECEGFRRCCSQLSEISGNRLHQRHDLPETRPGSRRYR